MLRRVLTWLGAIVLILLVVAAAGLAYTYHRTDALIAKTYTVSVPPLEIPTDPARIAHGKYLADKVSMCSECHDADLGGKMVQDNLAMGHLAAVNLTRGAGGVGGQLTDADFVRALLHGVKPDGHSAIFMPSQDYHFTETDAADIIAYVRSVPPVDREFSPPVVGPVARVLTLLGDYPLLPAERIDHEKAAFLKSADTSTPVASGAYLVATAGCIGCHGQDFTGGGGPPPGAANITPVGLAGWTEKDFMTALREHKRPDGTTIDEAMPRALGQMSDADLEHIFAYLQTVPPKGTKTKNQLGH